MFKTEYEANVQGFSCIAMQAPRAQIKVEGINLLHVFGYVAIAFVLVCVIFK